MMAEKRRNRKKQYKVLLLVTAFMVFSICGRKVSAVEAAETAAEVIVTPDEAVTPETAATPEEAVTPETAATPEEAVTPETAATPDEAATPETAAASAASKRAAVTKTAAMADGEIAADEGTTADGIAAAGEGVTADGDAAADTAELVDEFGQPYRLYEAEWGTDVSLKGLFDSTSIYFQVGRWNVRDARLELHLDTSGLLNKEVSYLSISLDGQPVETISLPENGREEAVCSVSLPVESLTPESAHSLMLEAYLRGQTTDACVDDSSLSTWINLFGTSKVELRYDEPQFEIESIADFYHQFVSIEALEGKQCVVATREGAPDSALTAMARILSGFAQTAAGDVEAIRGEEIRTEGELCSSPYVIYVDRFDNLPSFLKDAMTQVQKNFARADAAVCLVQARDTKVLLVTGNNDDALEKAGDLLSNPERISALTGKQEQIDPQQDYKADAYQWDEYLPLTSFGAEIKGNFEQSASFSVYCPNNRRLADSAELSLDYRYSANLDFEKSLLTVFINGTPVGSRALTQEGANGTTEIFSIPQDIAAVGSFTVETRFALYPKGDWCELTPEEIPWAYVADTSMLKWTTTENTEVFFEYYPFPFVKDGEFSETKLLLPEHWTKEDLQTMAGIMLTMGGWVKSNAGELDVESGSSTEALTGYNLISVGSAAGNCMDTSDMKIIGGRGCAMLDLTSDTDMLHAAMVVTGRTETDMQKTLAILGDSSQLWRVSGDLFYTDKNEVYCHYIREPGQTAAPPKIQSLPQENDRKVPMIIVGSMLALLLLSLAMLLIKYGRGKNEK